MKILKKYISLQTLLPLIFGIVVFLFFSRYYRFHLHYEEQLQMFLFTSDYFWQTVWSPSGLADYIGTFLTQFYYIDWLGALIISLLLVVLQQQVYSLSRKIESNHSIFPLTFVPSILLLSLLCNENFLLSGLIAIILTVAFAQLYSINKHPNIRIFFLFLGAPILFLIAGGVFWLFGLVCVLLERIYFRKFTTLQWLLFFAIILLTLFSPVFFKFIFELQYPLSRFWWGLCYSRYPVVSPYTFLLVWLSVPVIILLYKFLPEINKLKISISIRIGITVLVAIAGTVFVQRAADFKKEEIMAYDYFARTQNWKDIITLANHKDPESPLSVACLNLALCKTGTMGDAMFRYFQNGTEGLLPSFQRDFTSPFVSGEVYYQLGFLNTALRYNFEAMEAIPDYKKSSRAFKRMAEINLLNGEYKVAEKYLNILKNTLFYRKWAKKTTEYISNPALIVNKPEWMELKKNRLTKDFLFSENEKDQMLGMLLSHNTKNKMAFEYLMAYTLLNKDLEHFVQYFPFGKELDFTEIPAHYQEALILYWASKSSNLNMAPWPISDAVKQNFSKYLRTYLVNGGENADPSTMKDFSQTYWYYNHFRK